MDAARWVGYKSTYNRVEDLDKPQAGQRRIVHLFEYMVSNVTLQVLTPKKCEHRPSSFHTSRKLRKDYASDRGNDEDK